MIRHKRERKAFFPFLAVHNNKNRKCKTNSMGTTRLKIESMIMPLAGK